MHNRLLFLMVLGCACFSCEDRMVFSQYTPIKKAMWSVNDTLQFTFFSPDTLNPHTLSINFRNDNTFPLNTLFLVTEMEDPSGKTSKDTLHYTLITSTGEWMGYGLASLKENKLQLRKNLVFSHLGRYRLNVTYTIPKNNEANTLQQLNGITDVGLQVEKESP